MPLIAIHDRACAQIQSDLGLPEKAKPLEKATIIDMRELSNPTIIPLPRETAFRNAVEALERCEDPRVLNEGAKDHIVVSQARVMRESRGARPSEDVTIIPLGTGSASPGRYRNGKLNAGGTGHDLFSIVSSTLIRIPNYGSILLDTGEGTWGQIARHFGTSKDTPGNAWTMLNDLKAIFISHMHADHVLGLGRVLKELCSVSEQIDRKERHHYFATAHL